MAKRNKKEELFSLMISMVVKGSIVIVFGVLFLLIYVPHKSSIDDMFAPRPEQLTGSYENIGGTANLDKVENGIHVATGMVYDENFKLVKGACTSCHSSKLITQNRATREGWKQMIRWMQDTQGLPDLGKSERKILDYLAKNYAPEEVGRRMNLDTEDMEWYTLNLD